MSRTRFILLATAGYAVLALGWIFLSDRLLLAIASPETLVSLSTAKGVFFVIATAGLLFLALRAVPPADRPVDTPPGRSPWMRREPMYAFAVVVTLAMVAMRHQLPSEHDHRLLLIFYMLPVILSALIGGLGPGLAATATAALAVDLTMTPALHTADASPLYQVQWALFVLDGVAVSVLSEMLRRSVARTEQNRRMLDSIVSGTSDAIFVKDLQGRYQLANAATALAVNRPVASILGADDRQLFDAASAADLATQDRAVLEAGVVRTLEERITNQDGRAGIYLVTKGPIRDEDGTVTGLFGISRDVTEAKRVETELRASKERLQRVIEATSDGVWDFDLAARRHYRSPRYCELMGTPPEAVDDTEVLSRLVHPDDLPLAERAFEAHIEGRTPGIEFDFRLATPGHDGRWLLMRGRAMTRDANGRATRLAGTLSDITERKQHELAQREAGVVFESSYEGIMMVGPDERITKVNPAFTRITGYTPDEAVGQSPHMLASGQHPPSFYRELWSSVLEHGFWRGEIWNRRKGGELYAELLSISVVRDARGQIRHFIGVFSDISQIKSHEAELDRVAHYDPLTGLPNRRLLSDRLNRSLVRASRTGRSAAVCFLDLDGFKAINDEYGHAVGDQLLVGVTGHLQDVLRADDTLARLGGDEFVLILSDIDSPEDCTVVLDRVLDAASQQVSVHGISLRASASIGVSLYPADNVDADTLLRHADQAMYQAKEAGKNRYQLFDPESDRKAQTHRRFVEHLRQALAREEFVLFYQPKVDLEDGRVVGAEALIRWQHPERGLLSPAEFLPHVHGSELESAFGEWVIRTALGQIASWSRQGLSIPVSVNVSASHLLQHDFVPRLAEALAQHPDVSPSQFELEVLETAAIGDMQQAIDILQRCRELGVAFSLDDFGTGYSSLTYLRKLPVDTLKIDQSFVRDMLIDADDLGIVEGVIQLAGVFKRQVIAEGVETLEHGALLRHLGCRLAQGYGIARPMPAGHLPAWCEAWAAEQTWLETRPA